VKRWQQLEDSDGEYILDKLIFLFEINKILKKFKNMNLFMHQPNIYSIFQDLKNHLSIHS
jgi:hypothetical protein